MNALKLSWIAAALALSAGAAMAESPLAGVDSAAQTPSSVSTQQVRSDAAAHRAALVRAGHVSEAGSPVGAAAEAQSAVTATAVSRETVRAEARATHKARAAFTGEIAA